VSEFYTCRCTEHELPNSLLKGPKAYPRPGGGRGVRWGNLKVVLHAPFIFFQIPPTYPSSYPFFNPSSLLYVLGLRWRWGAQHGSAARSEPAARRCAAAGAAAGRLGSNKRRRLSHGARPERGCCVRVPGAVAREARRPVVCALSFFYQTPVPNCNVHSFSTFSLTLY
jgi:hypothetical protein